MTRKLRILVVEDEAAIRTGLVDVLVYHGYDVEAAEDIIAARSNPPLPNTAVDGYGFAGGRGRGRVWRGRFRSRRWPWT